MATYTARNDLIKPDYTDAADIADLNDNFDFIDGSIAPCEWAKGAAPTVDDDVTLGYIVGSLWLDTTNHRLYICEDNTDTAAVWRQLYNSGATISTPYQITSTLADGGVCPITVTSKVVCTNLNADQLDGHEASDFLHADGTVNATKTITSTLADGTKPLDVTSKTVCTNLNADLLDGIHGSAYAILAGQAGGQILYGGTAKDESLTLYSNSNGASGYLSVPNANLVLGTKATTVPNFAIAIHEGTAGAGNPIYWIDGDGSTVRANLNKSSADELCFCVGDYNTVDFTIGTSGNIGVGGTATNSLYQFAYTGTPTDQGSEASIFGCTTTPTYTGAETASESYNGLQLNLSPIINSGHTNSGRVAGIYIRNLRNYSAVDANDAGTLTELFGLNFSFGHYNNHADESPVTTTSAGIRLIPYYRTGTITNLYGLYIMAPTSGGTATNRYPIYSLWDDQAYFQGQIYTAGNCSALTFTDRTPGYDGDGLADIKKIKNKDGKIDHDTLPDFARKKVEGGRVPDEHGVLPPKYMEDGRDLGAMISILVKAVQQLSEENDTLKAQMADAIKRIEVLEKRA